MTTSKLHDRSVADNQNLDAEHRVQISLVTALREALENDEDEAAVAERLDRLVSYTDAHFMAEQLLMRQYAYPLYEAHELEHDRLVGQVHELQRRYQAGELALTMQVARSLEEWLFSHTKGTDHALEEYLKKQGAAVP
jgi:hemerythrin